MHKNTKPRRILRPTTPIRGEDLPDTAVERGHATPPARSAPVGPQFDGFPRHTSAPPPQLAEVVFHRDGGAVVPDPTDETKKLELIRRTRIPASALHRPIKVTGHELRYRGDGRSRGGKGGRSWGRKNYLWRPREARPMLDPLVALKQRRREWYRIVWPAGVSDDDKELHRLVTVNKVPVAAAAARLRLRSDVAKKRLVRLRRRLKLG
jgi:hypothetical protein